VIAASKVRRWPVVSSTGVLEETLSMDDVILYTRPEGNQANYGPKKW
jgi:hypothetical protein